MPAPAKAPKNVDTDVIAKSVLLPTGTAVNINATIPRPMIVVMIILLIRHPPK